MKDSYFSLFILWLKTYRKFVLAIVALYIVFLIIYFPASIFISVLKLPGNIKVSGISGTAWSGNIQTVYISGIKLGRLSWKLHPAYLILGTVAADISVDGQQQYFNSWVKLSPAGKVELEDTRFEINLSSLQPLTYGMPVSYSGSVTGHFPVSRFYKNHYVALNGKLSLAKLEMISPQRQAFGDFDMDFRAEKEGMTSAQLKDKSELLSVSGTLTLSKKGLLKLSAKVAARQKGSSLDNAVSILGPRDATGSVQLNNHFKLW